MSACSLRGCKSYAAETIVKALTEYDVTKYLHILASRVDDMCLKIGCFTDDKSKHKHLKKELIKEINSISNETVERDKLHKYAEILIKVGKYYQMLNW